MGDCKDQIRCVLKGRIPSDKDLKKEITQAFRLHFNISKLFSGISWTFFCFLLND